MAGYATKVKRDIARWASAGLIDDATAAALSSDVGNTYRGVSFGAVLSMMAAALFAAAILLVVAANWEEIPRLMRVGLLFATILAGYAGGAMLKLRARDGIAEACWVLAATAFGASIALIGQMYHMSGDEKQAIFVWAAGTALAAAALRSGPLTIGTVLLSSAWMTMHGLDDWWSMRDVPLVYPVVAVVLYALSFWTDSRAARHLILLSLVLFAVLMFVRDESYVAPLALVAASVALFAFGHLRPAEAERLLGIGDGLPVQALVAFLAGVGIVQIDLIDKPGFLAPSIAAFAGIIAVLLLAGRENTLLRWLAYGAFIFQLCFIYVVLLGSMLGTAGFFIGGGLALSGLAWLISRLERRFSGPRPHVDGGAS